MQNLVRKWRELAPFYFRATATCATFFSSHKWRGGAKSGASAQHWACVQLCCSHVHVAECWSGGGGEGREVPHPQGLVSTRGTVPDIRCFGSGYSLMPNYRSGLSFLFYPV